MTFDHYIHVGPEFSGRDHIGEILWKVIEYF